MKIYTRCYEINLFSDEWYIIYSREFSSYYSSPDMGCSKRLNRIEELNKLSELNVTHVIEHFKNILQCYVSSVTVIWLPSGL